MIYYLGIKEDMNVMRLYHGSKAGLTGAIAPASRDFDAVFHDKQLDVFQMQRCDNQGKLFESLDWRDIDAKAFIRAFMNSRAAAMAGEGL